MDAEVLSALVRANIAGGLAVLLVLALRTPCRRVLGAGATYGLWLIPPVAMAASLLPGPTWDISFPIPTPEGASGPEAIPAPASASIPWPPIPWVIGAWAIGIAGSVGLIAIRQRQFMAALGQPELDADGLPIMRARDGFAVGPAVIGTLAPRIVLPADFETRYSAEERRVILAHERVHLFGHDAQANAVAALLQCLCWFNPLAHIAAYFFRIDQELNADAEVVRQFPEHQRAYAEALLKTQIASRSLILGCQWPAQSEHPLKQRIGLLSLRAQVPRLGGIAIAGVALFAGLVAWAGSPRIVPAPEGGPGKVIIWTMLKSERSQPDKARRMVAAQGSWSDVSYQLPDGERYRVSLNPMRLPDRVEVRVRVEHDGAVTELAPLKLRSAEPGLVHLDRLTVLVTVGEKIDMSLKEASMKVFRSTRVLALCAGSATALALGGGVASASPDSMEYVGYSPCTLSVKAVVPVTCDAETGLVHWRLQLHRNPSSHTATTYDLWVEYGETANNTNGIARGLKTIKQEGKWSMAGSGPKATIKLEGSLTFTHVGPNLIHPLNPDGSLMTGNSGWSFTLSNFNQLEKPADRSKAASMPEVSYQLTPLAGGPTVHGVFEGRTPCQGISRDLKIEAHPACEKLKWRVTLYKEPGADKPTTYKAEGTLFKTGAREGKWSSGSGPMGVTYKLEGVGGAPPIQLLRGDDDVLFFLGQSGAPLAGSADFSYTLNRRGAAPAS